ncbi:hypothetical protein Btru_027308 [Bulinus truncatus]|nr:hypothetical protein Btru_027308 [Bulinus truncatus]
MSGPRLHQMAPTAREAAWPECLCRLAGMSVQVGRNVCAGWPECLCRLAGMSVQVGRNVCAGLTQEDDDCSGCWLEMEDAILTASDFLKGDIYKHRDHPNEHSRSSTSRRFSHSVFKRSLDSSSADCDSCWLVLERIRTYIQASRDKDAASLGHLVKKAMLNNGWV